MSRQIVIGIGAVVIVALHSLQANAVGTNYFWMGGAGEITNSNYRNTGPPGNTLIAENVPAAADGVVYIGANSAVTLNGSGAGFGRLRLGHTTSGHFNGAGTLTVSNGAELQFNEGAAGVANAGIHIGSGHNATMTIDNSTVSTTRLVIVGTGSNVNRSGNLNILNGGVLNVNDGNLNLADTQSGDGLQGNLNLSGASFITVAGPGADMVLASALAKATYVQSGGTVMINDSVEIGPQSGTSTDTSFTISGGSLTTGTSGGASAGNFWVGRGGTINPVVSISGSAVLAVGNRFLMGGGVPATPPTVLATGAVTNHSGGAVNVDIDLRIADTYVADASTATYNLSGTGVLTTNITDPTTLTDGPNSTSTVIGRRGIGRFFQAGGTANFNSPLRIGDRETGAASVAANGLYKISAGDLNINAPTSTFTTHKALTIAANGTGEFRVVGSDATIDVDGDFAISSTASGNGTLAFELEGVESLSQITITGTATFGSGSILKFDTTNASPTAMTYDVLTAASITDSGIVFDGPGNWDYHIIEGGQGKVLQLFQSEDPGLLGDHNSDGVVDILDYVVWRIDPANNGNDQGYDDWAENYGTPPGSGSGQGQASVVPEPATGGMMLLLGLLGLFGRAAVRRR